jgi:hypothetical protein
MSLCFAFRCSRASGEAMMSDLVWRQCDKDGLITREGYSGAIVCPLQMLNSCQAQYTTMCAACACGGLAVISAVVAVGMRKYVRDRQSEALRLQQLEQQLRRHQQLIRRRQLALQIPPPPPPPPPFPPQSCCFEFRGPLRPSPSTWPPAGHSESMDNSIEMETRPCLQHIQVSLIGGYTDI